MELRNQCRGHWNEILRSLGISETFLQNQHGPCPLCGGRDRFRYDDKDGRGTYFCNQCGAGDGIGLAMNFLQKNFSETARLIRERLPHIAHPASDSASTSLKATECGRVQKPVSFVIWDHARPLGASPLAQRYFNSRKLDPRGVSDVRFHPDVFDGQGGSHPALLSLVRDIHYRRVQISKTLLAQDGVSKARIKNPKRMMRGGLVAGSSVQLYPAGPTLGIAEGVETAISARKLFGIPVWAALSSVQLECWQPPTGVREIIIFGDNDVNCVGQDAAETLSRRLNAEGFRVTVRIPNRTGEDWNDCLVRRHRDVASPAKLGGSH